MQAKNGKLRLEKRSNCQNKSAQLTAIQDANVVVRKSGTISKHKAVYSGADFQSPSQILQSINVSPIKQMNVMSHGLQQPMTNIVDELEEKFEKCKDLTK